jgi:hypothetical protein
MLFTPGSGHLYVAESSVNNSRERRGGKEDEREKSVVWHQCQRLFALSTTERPRSTLWEAVVASLNDELDVGKGFWGGEEGFVCGKERSERFEEK